MTLTPKQIHFLSPDIKKPKSLMKTAFPKVEQTPFGLLLLGTVRKNTHFTAFYHEYKFAGLLYSIESEKYYFIFYLAVNPNVRSEGFGGEILDYAYEQAGERIIVLNVEPLDPASNNYEQRKRRVAFYKKHGIYETGYTLSDKDIEYSVLASNLKKFDYGEYKKMLESFVKL